MKKHADEIEKSKYHIVAELLDYAPSTVTSKTILTKTTGEIILRAFAKGEKTEEKIIPFDIFIQVIEGTAEVIINNKKQELELGMSIIIPAHEPHSFRANEQFKMISTIIKSGYEDVTL